MIFGGIAIGGAMLAAATAFRTRRMGAGAYLVTDGKNSVVVFRFEEGMWRGWWLARSEWSNDVFSDPVPTKRDAVRVAREMIEAHRRGDV